MNRLGQVFARARGERRAALIVYLCAGDPDLETTRELLLAAAEAGADIIEVGMPFSDPTADGPVIQRASERALASGTTVRGVLDVVAKLRARSDVGVTLFGYYNPLLAFGEREVAAAAAEAGVDAFMVVDLPPDDDGPLLPALAAQGLDFIPFLAPTTPDERVDRIARSTRSFLYYVSLTGVTGAQTDLARAGARAAALRERTGLPVAVGFGVKTPDDVRALAGQADGIVVGSAICRAIEQAADGPSAVANVRELVRSLRAACGR